MIQEIKLNLGGKERVFTFGLTFLGEVMEKNDPLQLEEVIYRAVKFPAKYAPSLMYESLRNTQIMDSKEVDFTELDIKKWLEKEDGYGAELMITFLSTFLGTTENKTPVEDDVKTDDKKASKKK